MVAVYSINDRVKHAFLVEDGPLTVTFDGCLPYPVEGDGLIVGTYELLTASIGTQINKRVCTVEAKDGVPFHPIDLITVGDMMEQYRFGFHSNRFLAAQLEIINSCYLQALNSLPKEEQQYRLRCRLFAQIVMDLDTLGERLRVRELQGLAKLFKPKGTYQIGSDLVLEQRFASMALPNKPMTDYLEEFAPGTVICKQGDEATSMFILLSGTVAVLVDGRYVAEIIRPGEAFGEIALLRDGLRTATIIANEKCSLCKIERSKLAQFHSSHSDLFRNLALSIAQRITRVREAIPRLLHCSATTESGGTERQLLKQSRKDIRELIDSFEIYTKKLALPELDALWNQYSEYHSVEQEEKATDSSGS